MPSSRPRVDQTVWQILVQYIQQNQQKALTPPDTWPFPIWDFFCSDVEASLSRVCHILGLWILNTPAYFYIFCSSITVKHYLHIFQPWGARSAGCPRMPLVTTSVTWRIRHRRWLGTTQKTGATTSRWRTWPRPLISLLWITALTT